MLEYNEFKLLTDHQPLCGAIKNPNERSIPKELRRLQYLSEFEFNIEHISGEKNVVADALSRQVYGVSCEKIKFHSIFRDELIEAQSKCDEIKLFIAPTEQSIKLINNDGLYCEKIKNL